MNQNFLEEIKKNVVVFDGAMGTMLQAKIQRKGFCPEEINIIEPKLVKEIHASYRDAGAMVLTTNTFGANRIKLEDYGLQDRVFDLNFYGVKIAREVAGDDLWVAGSIGPTGKLIEPLGSLSFDEAVDVFKEQARALEEAGCDIFKIETMMDIKEAKAAIVAIKEVSRKPIIALMTFEKNERTVLGTTPEVAAIVLESAGADVVGANCSLGVEGIYNVLQRMFTVTSLPLMAQPNAGIPEMKDGISVFPDSPDKVGEYTEKFIDMGVKVIGGCCGTTPQHIRRIREQVSAKSEYPLIIKKIDICRVASRSKYVIVGGNSGIVIIGERINPSGRKALMEELRKGNFSTIIEEARGQAGSGAHMLDINMGIPMINEREYMKKAVLLVNSSVDLPVVIDSPNPEVMEEGVKACDGKPLLNSVTGEEKKLETVIPLAKKYGGALIGLTLDEKGVPSTAEERLRIAEKIFERAVSMGISPYDIIIDPLCLTASADPLQPVETLKAIKLIKEKLGVPTILGISNVSFGLPKRGVINAVYLCMAVSMGLDAAIVNPYDENLMNSVFACDLLMGRDPGAERYIGRFSREEGYERSVIHGEALDIKTRIIKCVIEGNKEQIISLVDKAIDEGNDILEISNSMLIPGLTEIGKRFEKNLIFLPQVMASAETVKVAFDYLKGKMGGRKGKVMGKVLLATVEGDVHDIGKNIVGTLLENHGFEVIDLGKNVPSKRILEEAIKNRVDIVGLSALMTTTMMEMKNCINMLRNKGIKCMTVVGGAVITEEFARQIGADAYAKDAVEAVAKVKELLGIKES